MGQQTSAAAVPHEIPVVVPPLEVGDHLSRSEFERRYQASPRIKKAELVEGVVYMPSPVHLQSHAEPHASILTWLGVYRASTPQVRLADNATVRLDLDNEPQPDALLRLEPTSGGRSHVSEDDYLEGPPELIVEVASSSASYDLHEKLRVYRRNGVQEYLVWRVEDKQIDWFRLIDEKYIRLEPDASGILHSQVFPGLYLAISALLDGNIVEVLVELQKGLQTPEHTEFVERLKRH